MLVILGAAAIILPEVATLAFTLVIGWLFLISAAASGWSPRSGCATRPASGGRSSPRSSASPRALSLIRWPINGTVSLTLVLIAFFIVEGIATLMYAIEHRTQLSGRWGWMLASGIVDLILAGIIFAGLPGTATWALGLLVGINMLFGGTAMIGMALAAKNPA